jgi:hypothetical protein
MSDWEIVSWLALGVLIGAGIVCLIDILRSD